jgi:tyrosyl-tRNA synthetase
VALANAVTSLCRGDEAAKSADSTASATFAGGGVGEDLPVCTIPAEGFTVVDALAGIGFAGSRGEAKRLVAGGGARLDGEAITDESHRIEPGQGERRISAGKKKHGILRPA